jgi:hypothetical protein
MPRSRSRTISGTLNNELTTYQVADKWCRSSCVALLRDLYILFGEKIKPFVAQSGKYTNQQAVGSEEILQLLKFYQQAGGQVGELIRSLFWRLSP